MRVTERLRPRGPVDYPKGVLLLQVQLPPTTPCPLLPPDTLLDILVIVPVQERLDLSRGERTQKQRSRCGEDEEAEEPCGEDDAEKTVQEDAVTGESGPKDHPSSGAA
ncbi:hypothetical protein NDU88_004119 [Pleurodeles waltl]|uniref:Uncharacterized protein n=1 Tax=Pleurodeles waltl TaxID=8319 RepID=A0AAV7RFS7_PLEWA|nr:hypothetical protein NDU88_004119 [Pleurodeles waltl]